LNKEKTIMEILRNKKKLSMENQFKELEKVYHPIKKKGIKRVNMFNALYDGQWSTIEEGWWEKKILPFNLYRSYAVSFTFSEESFIKHDVLKLAKGIIVYYSGGVYHMPRSEFKNLRLLNAGNGWNYFGYLGDGFRPLDKDLKRV